MIEEVCDEHPLQFEPCPECEIDRLRVELEREKKLRVKYQDIIYGCCHALDKAFLRSVKGGDGTTIDMVVPDISFLNRLRKEAVTRAEQAEAREAALVEACGIFREASFQSHNGHWDNTMREGGEEMTDVESACKRLIGNLEHCVAVLHRLKRYDGSRDAEAASKAIESANKAIYEVSPVVWGKTEKPTKEVKNGKSRSNIESVA